MSKLPIPFGNPSTYPGHFGVDFMTRVGTPIPAGGPGVISERGYGSRPGYWISVLYDNGVEVTSCHLPSHDQSLSVGTRVGRGTIIGVTGNTGNSSGPHLHQEVTGYATTPGYWLFHNPNDILTAGTGNGSGGQESGNLTSRPTKDIQAKLKSVGLYTGEVDGIWGPLTEAAVREMQRINGVEVDGLYGPVSDGLLFPNTTPKPPVTDIAYDGSITPGVWGPNPFGIPYTGGLQKIAKLYGYSGGLDQNFGPGSMAGLGDFLRANWGYTDLDDILGPNYWAALQRWLKARWGYSGEIDGIPGPLTRQALLRADTGNWAEL